MSKKNSKDVDINIKVDNIERAIKAGMKHNKKNNWNCGGGSGGAIYGLGFIGALVFYVSTATTFWVGVLGILKAIVWPAFLVYEVLKFLGM